MIPRLPAVQQHIRIRAAGFFEGIRKDRQAIEGAILVERGGDGDDGRREPCGIGDDGTEGIVTNYVEENMSNKFNIRKSRRLKILRSRTIGPVTK